MAEMLHEGVGVSELAVEVNGEKSVVRLEAEAYKIGRAETNQLCFPIAGLSREHLAIERQGGFWIARDLGSTNGTLLNGEQLAGRHLLHSGDRIQAGPVTLTFRDPETAEPWSGTQQARA